MKTKNIKKYHTSPNIIQKNIKHVQKKSNKIKQVQKNKNKYILKKQKH